jgi:hypothetical protein
MAISHAARRRVRRAHGATTSGSRSVKIRRGHCALVQTNLRTQSCQRGRATPQGRSASVRVYRLWTQGVKAAQTGQATIDRVMIASPDRLARNYVYQMVLLEEFAQGGCRVEFLNQPLGQDSQAHLLLHIRGAVAEYERTLPIRGNSMSAGPALGQPVSGDLPPILWGNSPTARIPRHPRRGRWSPPFRR